MHQRNTVEFTNTVSFDPQNPEKDTGIPISQMRKQKVRAAEQFAKGPQWASNPAETLTAAVLHSGPLLITTLLPVFFSFLPIS